MKHTRHFHPSPVPMIYCQRKLKNKKWGRPGNEDKENPPTSSCPTLSAGMAEETTETKIATSVGNLKKINLRKMVLLVQRLLWEAYYQASFRGGVTTIGPIVTAATALVNPYTKEGVESLHILPYTSVIVRIVNGQWLKFNAVNGQSPKISVVNSQNAEKSWSKF